MTGTPNPSPQSRSKPVRILIFGANGVFGRRTLRRLSLVQNLELRAVCRSRAQASLLADTFGSRVVPFQGNVNSLDDVRTLSQGVDAIFHCAGPFSTQPLHPLTVELDNDIDYADLGDNPTYLKIATRMIASTNRKGRLTICGASSLPSMTSLLTHLGEVRFGSVEQIDIHVFIGNRNPKGWGAIQYLIHALRHPFLATVGSKQVLTESWSVYHHFRNALNSTTYPFSRIESPEDHFFPQWFGAHQVAFWVSLQYAWIHHVIRLIKAAQRVSSSWFDPTWVNLLFYGHPIFLKRFGSTQGWLHVTTPHRTAQGVQTIGQQLSATDEGQRVPSFPLTIIGRILAGELPRPTSGVTRFIDVLSPQEFLEELALEGISYQTSA
jgi:hypothetical protein